MSREWFKSAPGGPVRGGQRFWRLTLLMAGCGWGGWAAAEAPMPAPAEAAAPSPATPAGRSDVVLARAALAALDAEPELRGVNVIVSVVDRVAVLGGAVSHPRQAQRIEEVVRSVPGIVEVRNGCFVCPGPDPLLRAVAERASPARPPQPVVPHLPGILTDDPQPVPPWAGSVAAAEPTAGRRNSETVVARRPAGGADHFLGAPVRVEPAASYPPQGPTVGRLIGQHAARLPAAVRAVVEAEPRFDGLTIRFDDGVVWVGSPPSRAADAWALADRLRHVPGVVRVVVGENRESGPVR